MLAVVALYLPAVWGTVVSIDDRGILNFYGASQLSLLDVIRPGGGYYYRPITALSFYLDAVIWGQNPYLLHLENVLMHAANTGLLFLLARRLFPGSRAALAWCAALVFAVHPANCEAVSWIAGRTDPLATLFVLASALALVKALETDRLRYSLLAMVLLLLGMLAKETALMFLPASLFLVYAWPRLSPGASPAAVRRQGRLLWLCCLVLGLMLALLLYYRMGTHGNSAAKLLHGWQTGPAASLVLALKVLGFYLKKLVLPWPFNFAITKIPDWYLVPGCAGLVLLATLALAPRKNPGMVPVVAGFLFLVPALVVALCNVAWCVAAERYLYLPSAFFSLGLAAYLFRREPGALAGRFLVPVLSLCLVLAAGSTLKRMFVWHSNLALFQDTVANTPDFGMLRNELAVALVLADRDAEAKRELDIASSLDNTDLVKRLIRRNRKLLAIKQAATPRERRAVVVEAGWKPTQEDTELLDNLRHNDYLLLKGEPSRERRDALISELIEISEILFARTGQALLLYNNGQLHLQRGDQAKAAACFSRSYRAAPEGAYYKKPARTLAEKLGGQRL
jgi:protein O-mannosyl-transferase